jgi:hypothetical protein
VAPGKSSLPARFTYGSTINPDTTRNRERGGEKGVRHISLFRIRHDHAAVELPAVVEAAIRVRNE